MSNLCLNPAALRNWMVRVRRRHVTLPLHPGIAGPIDTAKLASVAARIGVGQSARFLGSHPSWFLRLARPGGYSPERLLRKTSDMLSSADSGIAGLHIFTFGQLAATERWRRRLLEQLDADDCARLRRAGA